MKTNNIDIEAMRERLINYYMNLSSKHDRHAHEAVNVRRMNIHLGLSNNMRKRASDILNKKDTYIIRLYNDIFNIKID